LSPLPNQLAKSIIDIATGQKPGRDPTPEEEGKDPAAVARWRRVEYIARSARGSSGLDFQVQIKIDQDSPHRRALPSFASQESGPVWPPDIDVSSSVATGSRLAR
jgi:hypothetical protein